MENTNGESQLYAVLIADGEKLSETPLSESTDDGERLSRYFVTTTAKNFQIKIGTYSELIYSLPLYPKEFKGGERKGFAGRIQASIDGRTWHFRANLVKQDEPGNYGVTIGVKPPPPKVALSWADEPAAPKQKKQKPRSSQPRNSTDQPFDSRSLYGNGRNESAAQP
jgi:hypothetical protein